MQSEDQGRTPAMTQNLGYIAWPRALCCQIDYKVFPEETYYLREI